MSSDPRIDPRLTVDTIRHVDEICTVFEQNWRGGERPAIEDFLSADAGVERSALLCELLAVEIEYRLLAGEQPAEADYVQRFPADRDVVELTFQEADELTRRDEHTINGKDRPAEALAQQPAFNLLPRVFGDYELLEEIARGGMGVVYKAHQLSLDRIVAVKMILSGRLASAVEVERFYAEAKASAKLHHPGIVPIIEVGQREGQHFFAMNLVEGVSLAQRLADGPLPPKEAAQLLRATAEAVQYAHERGVIHRDLKPANILLDADSQPHITDFGLAKGATHDSSLTATGQIIGTPSFMPPEQAAGTMVIGPASDLYSLGAVLYAALTGRPPFQAANTLDTLRQVAEREPVAPRTLNASVPRDLETVCLKCLEKDPRRRYATAQELAGELARYLSGNPILARPVPRIERAWRWARRQPVIAALAALVVLSLTSGTAMSTYFAVQAQREASAAEQSAAIANRNATEERNQRMRAEEAERTANSERERAEVQTATAQEVSNFLVGLVQGADPIGLSGYSLGQAQKIDVNTTALELLDRGARMVQEQLADQPEVQAKLMQTIGDVYTSFFRFDAAEPLLEKSLELRRQRFGNKHLQVADSLHSLAVFHFSEGDFEGAEKLCREGLAIRRELLGDEHLDVAMSEFALGWSVLFGYGGRGQESEQLMRSALAKRLAQLGPSHRDVALVRLGLAFALIKSDKLLPAFQELGPAMAAFDSGGGDTRAANALSSYLAGIAAQRRQQPGEAAKYFEQALEQIGGLFGSEHPMTNYLKCELAEAQLVGRDNQAAERVFRATLDSNRKLLGRRPFVAESLRQLARNSIKQGRYEEAEPLFKEALAIQSEVLGPESAAAGMVWGDLASVSLAEGELDEAFPRFQAAVRIFRKSNPNLHQEALHGNALLLAWSALREDMLPEFREACRDLLNTHLSSYGPIDAELTAYQCTLIPGTLDDPFAAVSIAREAVAADGNNCWFQRALGAALYRAGRIDESFQPLERCIALQRGGGNASVWLFLAMAHCKTGHVDKARAALEIVRPWIYEQIPQLRENSTAKSSADDAPPVPPAVLAALGEPPPGIPLAWHERPSLKRLFQEAVSLIDEADEAGAKRTASGLDGNDVETIETHAAVLGMDGGAVAPLYRDLFDTALRRGDFQRASSAMYTAFQLYAKISPAAYDNDSWHCAFHLSWIALHEDNLPLFREACKALVARRQVPGPPHIAEWTATWCSWLPDVLVDPHVVVRLAEEAVAADERNLWFQKALGSTLYRAGKFDEAIEHLVRSIELDPVPNGHITMQLFLAMAHYKAGHLNQAPATLEPARQWIKERASALDMPQTKGDHPEELSVDRSSSASLSAGVQLSDTPISWRDRSPFRHLYLEATSLIDAAVE